jgi:hypothetical protein
MQCGERDLVAGELCTHLDTSRIVEVPEPERPDAVCEARQFARSSSRLITTQTSSRDDWLARRAARGRLAAPPDRDALRGWRVDEHVVRLAVGIRRFLVARVIVAA